MAALCGNELKEAWYFVLSLIIKLDFMYSLYSTNSGGDPALLKQAEIIFSYLDDQQINKVYNQSANLDAEGIMDFIQQLIRISEEELSIPQPRLFALQRIVETTDLNMSRIKLVWANLWNRIKEHFNKVLLLNEVGCHGKAEVSMYAIDSLKQLSFKFLKKGELAHFQGQRDFLQPYETIFLNLQPAQSEMKELILCCLQFITQ